VRPRFVIGPRLENHGIFEGSFRIASEQSVIDELLARQQTDGGWSQTATMKSDAFATGQTLYVLSLADYTAERPDVKRAINFLVATQKPDGSWPMTSRSTPDGKPGSAKLLTPITCAASAWATLGLARLAPRRP
jgi:prenyltransferase beta subunit